MSNELNAIKEKVDCSGKTTEDLVALAKEHGVELSDEQMDQISGGGWTSGYYAICRHCGEHFGVEEDTTHTQCPNCGSQILVS